MFGPNYKTTGWFEHRLNIPLKLCRCLKLNLAFTSHKDLDLMVCYPSSRGAEGWSSGTWLCFGRWYKGFYWGNPQSSSIFSKGFSIHQPFGGTPHGYGNLHIETGWWFGTFFFFPYIGNNHPNWLIFFRGVQTTNQERCASYWKMIMEDVLRPLPFQEPEKMEMQWAAVSRSVPDDNNHETLFLVDTNSSKEKMVETRLWQKTLHLTNRCFQADIFRKAQPLNETWIGEPRSAISRILWPSREKSYYKWCFNWEISWKWGIFHCHVWLPDWVDDVSHSSSFRCSSKFVMPTSWTWAMLNHLIYVFYLNVLFPLVTGILQQTAGKVSWETVGGMFTPKEFGICWSRFRAVCWRPCFWGEGVENMTWSGHQLRKWEDWPWKSRCSGLKLDESMTQYSKTPRRLKDPGIFWSRTPHPARLPVYTTTSFDGLLLGESNRLQKSGGRTDSRKLCNLKKLLTNGVQSLWQGVRESRRSNLFLRSWWPLQWPSNRCLGHGVNRRLPHLGGTTSLGELLPAFSLVLGVLLNEHIMNILKHPCPENKKGVGHCSDWKSPHVWVPRQVRLQDVSHLPRGFSWGKLQNYQTNRRNMFRLMDDFKRFPFSDSPNWGAYPIHSITSWCSSCNM